MLIDNYSNPEDYDETSNYWDEYDAAQQRHADYHEYDFEYED